MKANYIVCLLLALGLPAPAFPRSGARAPSSLYARAQSPASESRALSATFTILAQRYCHVDDESFVAMFDVRLHFTNVSGSPVILSRRIDNTDLVRVAKSVETGETGQFEYAPNPDRFTTKNPSNPPTGDAPNGEYFIILNPRQSYDVTIHTNLFGTKEPTSGHGLISRGAHVLKLGVSTWPYYGYEDVQNLRKKWARFGDLQLGIVYTNFVPFEIPKKFKNLPCPNR